MRLLGCERPTFGDMNAVAAQQLAGVLLPAARRDPRGDVVGGGGSGRRLMLLHDVSRDLCCHSMTRLAVAAADADDATGERGVHDVPVAVAG